MRPAGAWLAGPLGLLLAMASAIPGTSPGGPATVAAAPVNLPPIALPDAYTTPANTVLKVAAPLGARPSDYHGLVLVTGAQELKPLHVRVSVGRQR